jgi:hypothetical protein
VKSKVLAGKFEEAVRTIKKVHPLAISFGLEDLVLGSKKKLRLYQTVRLYRKGLLGEHES